MKDVIFIIVAILTIINGFSMWALCRASGAREEEWNEYQTFIQQSKNSDK